MRSRDVPPPRTYEELRQSLQDLLPHLSAGQRRIARILLIDPEGSAFRTIGETARAAEVAESSVVRFATALGLAGYPALVDLCRQQLADQAQLLRRFEQAQQPEVAGDLLGSVVQHDQLNLTRTFSQIDENSWETAVTMLSEAPAVHVMGMRKCYSVAYLLTYLLRMVRPGIRQLAARSDVLVDELRDITSDDVFVAISIHRYTANTVQALAYAKQRHLQTIVLTDNAASPLVTYADVVFYVETSGVTILRSLSGFISLVQALATAVALRRGTRSRSELLLDESLLDEFGVYASESSRSPAVVALDETHATNDSHESPESGTRRKRNAVRKTNQQRRP